MHREKAIILLPRLSVINANLISGPLTWGFPAMTAFLGAVHNLTRRLPELPFSVDGVGVVCHQYTPQTSKSQGGYVHYLHLSRTPVNEKGASASIVEEGKVHMTVSLVLQVDLGDAYLTEEEGRKYIKEMMDALQGMRIAGGSVQFLSRESGSLEGCWLSVSDDIEEQRKNFFVFRRKLLPGFALIDRHTLLASHLEKMREKDEHMTSLDALLDICALHHTPPAETGGEWITHRRYPGWLVPVPVGYRAISPLYSAGEVKNTRDNETPFCFVESICSLGEWISPHRLKLPQEMLWRYEENLMAGEYRTVGLTYNE